MQFIKPTQELIDALRRRFEESVNNLSVLGDTFSFSVPIKTDIEEQKKKPVVHFLPEASAKMWSLVNNSSKEVGWHGLATRVKDGYLIRDIILFPQTVTAATVQTDDDEYVNWLNSLSDADFDMLRFHGHSHVNMGVSPSGVDTTYYSRVLTDVKDFYIFMILNKNWGYHILIYDVEKNLMFNTKDLVLDDPLRQTDWAEAQIKKFVKEPKPAYQYQSGISAYAQPSYYDKDDKDSKCFSYTDYLSAKYKKDFKETKAKETKKDKKQKPVAKNSNPDSEYHKGAEKFCSSFECQWIDTCKKCTSKCKIVKESDCINCIHHMPVGGGDKYACELGKEKYNA